MAVQVTFEDLSEKVEAGWKKAQLAEHYELPMTQMTKLLQKAGLKIRKFHAPKFELIMPTSEVALEEVLVDSEESVAPIDVAITTESVEEVLEAPEANSPGW